jgi:hypothetical protein
MAARKPPAVPPIPAEARSVVAEVMSAGPYASERQLLFAILLELRSIRAALQSGGTTGG